MALQPSSAHQPTLASLRGAPEDAIHRPLRHPRPASAPAPPPRSAGARVQAIDTALCGVVAAEHGHAGAEPILQLAGQPADEAAVPGRGREVEGEDAEGLHLTAAHRLQDRPALRVAHQGQRVVERLRSGSAASSWHAQRPGNTSKAASRSTRRSRVADADHGCPTQRTTPAFLPWTVCPHSPQHPGRLRPGPDPQRPLHAAVRARSCRWSDASQSRGEP